VPSKGAGIERTPERPFIDTATVLDLGDAIEPRLRALVYLAAFATLRSGELLGLERRDIDLQQGPAGAPLLSGAKHAQLASCLLGEQDVIARLGECSQGLLFTGSCPSSVASARQRAVSSAVGVSASSFGARVW